MGGLKYLVAAAILLTGCVEGGAPTDSGSSPQVAELQQLLRKEGYFRGEVDGVGTKALSGAIRTYQSDWGLPVTGRSSSELLSYLRRDHPDTKPRDFKIEGKDCRIENPYPQPQETVSWTGACVNGRPEGEGKLVWRYLRAGNPLSETFIGTMVAGRHEGKGVMIRPDGGRYDGPFVKGEFTGMGTYTFPNGDKYVGGFVDYRFEGQGTISFASGARFEGTFVEGQRQGPGVMNYSDGGRYNGNWKDNRRHGRGTSRGDDGTIYTGEWREDWADGQGTVTLPDGRELSGRWRLGCLEVEPGVYAALGRDANDCPAN